MVAEGVEKDHAYTISPSPPPSTSEVKWLTPYNLLISKNIRNLISERQRQPPKRNWSFQLIQKLIFSQTLRLNFH